MGETLNIKGGQTNTDKLSENNIGVVKGQDDSTLNVKLAKNLKGLESVTTGTNGQTTVMNADGVTVTNGAQISKFLSTGIDTTGTLTATGAITQGANDKQIVIDNGKITGLSEAPTGNNDATNKKYVDDQNNTQNEGLKDLIGGNTNLGGNKVTATDIGGTGQNTVHGAISNVKSTADNALAKANQGFKLQANGKEETTIKPGDTVNFQAADKNVLLQKEGNKIGIAINTNPEFTTLKTTGGAEIQGTLKAASGIESGNNINMLNHKITNLADGDQPNDAVNKGQLDGVKTALTNQITEKTNELTTNLTNKGTKYQGDDNQEVSRNLGETLTIKGGVAKDKLTTENNIGVIKGDEENTLNVKLAKDLTGLDSVTVAKTVSVGQNANKIELNGETCLLYTSPSPRD